jgi:type I restriction enzyme S subunit
MAVAVGRRWETLALGNLAEFRNGVNYNKDNFGRGIKVINVKDFQDYSIASFENLDEVNLSGVIKEKDLLRAGDIIFVRSNGNRELIGRNLFIKDIQESVTHSAFTIKLRFTSNQVIPRFYAYLFRSSLMRQTLSAHGNGTNISNLNQGILSSLQVPLPPLPIQRKIAGILSAYDRLIENNTRRIEILEEMARSLYREWFVNFRFPGHEQVQMVDSALGLIPEGWEVQKLGEVADINKTSLKTGDAPEEINYIDISSVSIGKIDKIEFITFSKASSRARRIVKHGDIIWATVRPNRKSYSLILNPIPNLIISTGFAVITPKKAPYTYLYHALTTDDFVGYLTNNATGSAYPAVNTGDFKNADVLIPRIEFMDKFHNIVADIFSKKDNLLRKNTNLSQTRDLLLPRLISGEIDVENLEINTGELANPI